MYDFNTWDNDCEFHSKTISGNNFSDFLELCFHNADFFSFKKATWLRSTCKELENELEPFLVKEICTQKWFGYGGFLDEPSEDSIYIDVYLYNADMRAKDIILKHCDDIFLQKFHNGVLEHGFQTLEDLCFLSNGEIFVGTVSHGCILSAYPQNKEFETSIMKFGDWNYIEANPISIKKYI